MDIHRPTAERAKPMRRGRIGEISALKGVEFSRAVLVAAFQSLHRMALIISQVVF
jgi:hypothetical protein